jgi:hypothetical protein
MKGIAVTAVRESRRDAFSLDEGRLINHLVHTAHILAIKLTGKDHK